MLPAVAENNNDNLIDWVLKKVLLLLRLGSGGLEVGDEVISLLLLLEAGEDHLGAGDVLLGVDEVLHQRVRAPRDAGALVGLGVGEAFLGAGVAAEEAVEVRDLLVGAALLHGVALRALGLEGLGTLGGGLNGKRDNSGLGGSVVLGDGETLAVVGQTEVGLTTSTADETISVLSHEGAGGAVGALLLELFDFAGGLN